MWRLGRNIIKYVLNVVLDDCSIYNIIVSRHVCIVCTELQITVNHKRNGHSKHVELYKICRINTYRKCILLVCLYNWLRCTVHTTSKKKRTRCVLTEFRNIYLEGLKAKKKPKIETIYRRRSGNNHLILLTHMQKLACGYKSHLF